MIMNTRLALQIIIALKKNLSDCQLVPENGIESHCIHHSPTRTTKIPISAASQEKNQIESSTKQLKIRMTEFVKKNEPTFIANQPHSYVH